MSKTPRVAPRVHGVALALALLFATGEASARGAGLDPSALAPDTRRALASEISTARAATPELFKAVADVAARARELEAAARTRRVPFTRYFKPLGNRALYPMLELLVFDAKTPPELPPAAEAALRLGLIEAIGAIRDARTLPVLAKLLEDRDADTARAAAEGLAKLGSDESLGLVLDAAAQAKSRGGSDRERALLSGLRDARRARAAAFLAERLEEAPDRETARVVLRSLGGVGNAWAWRALPSQAEERETRALAARALVNAYAAHTGELREAAAKSVLVVDDPSTPTLIAEARRRASREAAVALDALAERLANNPAR